MIPGGRPTNRDTSRHGSVHSGPVQLAARLPPARLRQHAPIINASGPASRMGAIVYDGTVVGQNQRLEVRVQPARHQAGQGNPVRVELRHATSHAHPVHDQQSKTPLANQHPKASLPN